MTFREMTFQDDQMLTSQALQAETDSNPFQAVMENQSPLMKLWFVVMLVNLGLFLFLIH